MTLAVRSENAPVTLPPEMQANQQIVQTLAWAQAADAVYNVAEKLVHTRFVPRAYQGKPMEATAAILAGAELGLSQMASLRAFDDIQGTPAPKAITLRAIVQGQGHEIVVKESTATVAVVAGRRRGTEEWQTSRWDLDRARQMGLLSKDQWKSQPTAMLIARATSECCRLIAADAIMGMPYSAEEIRDGDEGEIREAPRRVSLEEIEAAEQQPAIKAAATIGEPSETQPSHPASTSPAPVNPDPMPANRQKRMFALFNDTAFKERDVRLAFISTVVGREIGSSSDLTAAEGEQVVTALENHIAEQQAAAAQDGES